MSDGTPEIKPIEVGLEHFEPSEVDQFRASGYGRIPQLGSNPVLIVVDVTYEFCGPNPEIGDDTARPKSSGEGAWRAIAKLQSLIPAARQGGVPVIYTMNAPRRHPVEVGGWAHKTGPQAETPDLEIVSEIAPHETDLVVRKTKPSGFFGTPLSSWLIEIGADTAIIAGGTTSGCVRATVVDSFSHNLLTFVVRDAVFDRSSTSHEVNLFEMQQKYAGLVDTDIMVDWFLGRADTS